MKLVKILPDKIQIRTDDAEFVNARLDDLISVSDGEVELVTQICAITDNDVETQMDDNAIMEELKQPSLKVIECSVLGSVIDGEFKQQIDRYPSTDVKIHNISDFEFGAILAVDAVLKNSGAFQIAGYSGYDVPAYLDGNKFYQRHSCIVGNSPKRSQRLLRKPQTTPTATLSYSIFTASTEAFPMWITSEWERFRSQSGCLGLQIW